ncbi:hypothetical protein BT93_H1295 [Corymbia citriodora subsp. variegata]|nr:hypothetical protein BT93_H1295 [Corymbia citriodora subsp. variegata]
MGQFGLNRLTPSPSFPFSPPCHHVGGAWGRMIRSKLNSIYPFNWSINMPPIVHVVLAASPQPLSVSLCQAALAYKSRLATADWGFKLKPPVVSLERFGLEF